MRARPQYAPALSITNKISPVKQRVRDAQKNLHLLVSYSFPPTAYIYTTIGSIYASSTRNKKRLQQRRSRALWDNCIPIVRDRSRAPIDLALYSLLLQHREKREFSCTLYVSQVRMRRRHTQCGEKCPARVWRRLRPLTRRERLPVVAIVINHARAAVLIWINALLHLLELLSMLDLFFISFLCGNEFLTIARFSLYIHTHAGFDLYCFSAREISHRVCTCS